MKEAEKAAIAMEHRGRAWRGLVTAIHPRAVTSGAEAQARNLLGGFNGFHASSRLSANDPVSAVIDFDDG